MIKAAVIGAGYIAREHLDCLRNLKLVETVGICDLSPVMAEATADEFRVPRWFTDHRRMLAELRPDVVHVATPPGSHFPLAVDALEAGAHVLVEKPITVEPGDLQRLKELAGQGGRLLLENHNYLFNDAVRRIFALIDSGDFGDVVHVEVTFCSNIVGPGSRHVDSAAAYSFSSLPGGPIIDFITHVAYLTYAFVGAHRSVRTVWRKHSDVASLPSDEFRALVDAEHGSAVLGFSACSQPDALSLCVHGTKMRATANLLEPLLAIEKLRGGPRPLMPVFNGLSVARAYRRSAIAGLWRKLRGYPLIYEGLWYLVEQLYESLEAGGEPPVSMQQIEAVNRLVWDLLAQENRQ